MIEKVKLSEVEKIKSKSGNLRGTIEEGLKIQITGSLSEDDTQLTKFHGFNQQDNRDLRDERRRQKLEPLYSFMLRARVPGGVINAEQWRAIDKISRELTSSGIRLTTRQTFQYHGILKRNVKKLIRGINDAFIDSLAACGDVNRNVLCNANPLESIYHEEVYKDAVSVSNHLLPKSQAYHEIWLDEEKVADVKEEKESIYGNTYLPRKFKIAIAIPPHNDVDINGNDLSFVAIIENKKLIGYNVLIGGGMGCTNSTQGTYTQIAKDIGFIKKTDIRKIAEAVVTTQRDFGDRTDRKKARLKYTVDRMGVDNFKEEVEVRSKIKLKKSKDFNFISHADRFGWIKNVDGTWNLTLFIEHGRITDKPNGPQMLSGLLKITNIHQGEFRITATQNLMISKVEESNKDIIEDLAREYGLWREVSLIRQNSMACVAFPTCGLAMAAAERYLPTLISKIEELTKKHAIEKIPITIRMTGCPNGCARPYLAEIALVGKALGKYNLYLGGDGKGTRLVQLYRENIGEDIILEELDNLFSQYSTNREKNELFGDFLIRKKIVPAVYDGRDFKTGL